MSHDLCTRLDGKPGGHRLHVDGHFYEGWENVCCEHADQLMRLAGMTVPAEEARKGWAAWRKRHAEMCEGVPK